MGILKETPEQQAANNELDQTKLRFVRKKPEDDYFWNLRGDKGRDQIHVKDWSVAQLKAIINYIEAFPECKTIKNGDKKSPK